MATRVINSTSGEPFDVYIGPKFRRYAASKYANPFEGPGINPKEAALKFYDYLMSPRGVELWGEIEKLRGKRLGCPCRFGGLCHGYIIAYLLDGTANREIQMILERYRTAERANVITQPKEIGGVFAPCLEMHSPRYDRIRGALVGMVLGDALGAPHELENLGQPSRTVPVYSGRLEHKVKTEAGLVLPVGHVTDLTETTFVLADSLIRHKGYNHQDFIENLIIWEQSQPPLYGEEMRDLIGTGTYEEYTRRFEERYGVPAEPPFNAPSEAGESELYQSAFIRSFPIACLSENELDLAAIEGNVWATNPSVAFKECVILYLTLMKMALLGHEPLAIWEHLQTLESSPLIAGMFDSIASGEYWDAMQLPDKCWVYLTLYCVLKALYLKATRSDLTFEDHLSMTILSVRDTDADAAMVGMLLGALDGYEGLVHFPTTAANLKIILGSNLDRPETYRPTRIDSLADSLERLRYIENE